MVDEADGAYGVRRIYGERTSARDNTRRKASRRGSAGTTAQSMLARRAHDTMAWDWRLEEDGEALDKRSVSVVAGSVDGNCRLEVELALFGALVRTRARTTWLFRMVKTRKNKS